MIFTAKPLPGADMEGTNVLIDASGAKGKILVLSSGILSTAVLPVAAQHNTGLKINKLNNRKNNMRRTGVCTQNLSFTIKYPDYIRIVESFCDYSF
jgi:hypothetical protein